MSLSQFLILAIIALLTSVPVVVLVPRARQSWLFDRILWVATVIVTFLGAWLTIAFVAQSSALEMLRLIAVADVPLLPAIIGAIGGALTLNVPLWIWDLFSPPLAEGDTEIEESGENSIAP